MKSLKKILFFISLFTSVNVAYSQGTALKICMANDSSFAIRIRCFHENMFHSQGINIYRSYDAQTWQKITPNPLKTGGYKPSTEELMKDSMLSSYINVINASKPSELTGFVRLMLIIAAIQDKTFAKFLGSEFIDYEIKPGVTYYYKAAKVVGNSELTLCQSDPIIAGKYKPEEAPKEIVVKKSDASVNIKWKDENMRLWAYNIYRNSADGDQMQKLNATPIIISKVPDKKGEMVYPDFFYTDTKLKNNQYYRYRISGLDYMGNETSLSEAFIVMPQDTTPPLPVSYVRCKVETSNVSIHWENPVKENGIHNIYRRKAGEQVCTKINATPIAAEDTFYNENIKYKGKYFYYIESCDENLNCSKSNQAMAEIRDFTAPAKPRMLRIKADTGRLILTWNPNIETDVIGYRIYRCINEKNENFQVLLNSAPLNAITFTDSLPGKAKNRFIYRIAAVDSSFNVSELSEPAMARMPDVFPPERPFIKNVYADSGNIVVEWIPNIDPDLKGYNLYRVNVDSNVGVRMVNVELISANTKRFTDKLADVNKKYLYTLQAIDSSGNKSAMSPSFTAKLPKATSGASSKINITFNAKYQKILKSVNVTLSKNIPNDVDGMVVYRRTDTTPFAPASSFLISQDYTDKAVTKGTVYYYQIRFYLKNGEIIKSDEKTVKTE
jgi:hypothetical protein